MTAVSEVPEWLTELAKKALAEEGYTDGNDSNPHSWRCAYPDRYDPCTCASESAAHVASVIWSEIERRVGGVDRVSVPGRQHWIDEAALLAALGADQ